MDDGARRHVVPEPLIRSETTPSTTKPRRSRKIPEADSPMYKLSSSLTPTTLESPYGLNRKICDPMYVDTPQKSSQILGKITPQNNMKILGKISGETSSPVSTAESNSSTPRKNPRRSRDMTELKAVHRPSISRSKASKRIPGSKVHGSIKNLMPLNALSSESNASPQTTSINKDSPLPKRRFNPERNGVSSITSDWDLAWFQTNNTGISSEPRYLGRSDIGRFSTRRLSFTPQKTVNKQEYDPNEDAFTQSLIHNKFNLESVKQEIGKLLNSANIPTLTVKKSSTCDTNAKETPVSSKKRQSKSRSSLKTMKRTASAPELHEKVRLNEMYQPASEGTIRAFLRARDIIKNIRERAKNYRQILGTHTSDSNSLEVFSPVSEINSLSPSSTITRNFESPTRLTNNDSLNNSMDNSLHDADLTSTQPFQSEALQGKEQECLFAGVTAYVEVISDNENISAGVKSVLRKYGATVASSFTKDVPVTHVVFNDGHVSTYKKAKKRNLPMVSVLWIEACRKAGFKVDESNYPPSHLDWYETPSCVKKLKKRRIMIFPGDKVHKCSRERSAGKISGKSNDNIEKDTIGCSSRGKILENSFIKKLNKFATEKDGSEISGKRVMEYESDSQKDKTSFTALNLVKSDEYNHQNDSKKNKNAKRKLLSSSKKYVTDINADCDRNKSTTENPHKTPRRDVKSRN